MNDLPVKKKNKYPTFDADAIERQAKSVFAFLRYNKQLIIPDEDKIIADYITEQRTMHEVYSGLTDYENEIHDKNCRLLRAIKNVRGRSYHYHFKGLLQSLDRVVGVIKFSSKPMGEIQTENGFGRAITTIWVDQRSVGMEGDSFAGTVSVQIKPGKFLIIPYEC